MKKSIGLEYLHDAQIKVPRCCVRPQILRLIALL